MNSYHPQSVIAGLDPAIQESRMNAADFAHRMDCRVEPGNDIAGGVPSALQQAQGGVFPDVTKASPILGLTKRAR
jgi:hypothetical protein